MKYLIAFFAVFCSLFLVQCGEANAPKIDANMRTQIDTTVSKQMSTLARDLDAYCRDSSAALVDRLRDSLITVREQEILRVLPVH